MEDIDDDSRIDIFGYSKSRVEVFINGIIFLILQIGHEVFSIVQQLPSDWVEDDFKDIERPFWIPIFLFVISYSLMSHAVFGGKGRVEKLYREFGKGRIIFRKISLLIGAVLISSIFPIFIILIFF